jgi:hypothetical protein
LQAISPATGAFSSYDVGRCAVAGADATAPGGRGSGLPHEVQTVACGSFFAWQNGHVPGLIELSWYDPGPHFPQWWQYMHRAIGYLLPSSLMKNRQRLNSPLPYTGSLRDTMV